jgi:hypothetical protein
MEKRNREQMKLIGASPEGFNMKRSSPCLSVSVVMLIRSVIRKLHVDPEILLLQKYNRFL